jgi:hypothetical protein
MAIRFYLTPKEQIVNGDDFYFRPKYFDDSLAWRAIDYGKEPWMLVAADVTTPQHNAIAANVDVTAVPANLDGTVGAQLATVQNKLELANLPAHWVTSGMTWRTVLKWTIRLLLLQQRFSGLDHAAARLFSGGITLDSTVGDLPVVVRQRLNAAAQRWGLDTSAITLSTTIRSALITL